MPSTFTTNFAIEKPATGEQSSTWGITTNFNFDIFDRLAGYKEITMSSTSETLDVRPVTPTQGANNSEDGMYRVLDFVDSGTDLGGDVTLTIGPNTTQAFYIIRNSLTQGPTDADGNVTYRSIICSQGTGANATIPGNGKVSIIFCDGGGASAAVVCLSDTMAMSNPSITGGEVTNLTNLTMVDADAQAKAHTGLNVDAAGTAVALSIALG